MTDTPQTSLSLYFIADNTSIDHNRDLFTWAPSVEVALEDWRKNYETEDRPEGLFAIPIEPGARRRPVGNDPHGDAVMTDPMNPWQRAVV